MSVRLSDLTTTDEFKQVAALEKAVWAYADAEDVVPVPIMVVSVKCGGILIGAFDEADRMVGFVYSLPGLREGRPMQWSHMLGVVESHRNAGLGYLLKLEQRRRTIDMGLDLIEWTYDPLQAMNAHFNFVKLGAVVEEYERNVYGDSSSPLHKGTPTDRFVAQWWIRRPRVERRLAGGPAAPVRSSEAFDAPTVNLTRPAGEWLEPVRSDLGLDAPRLMVEIPTGFSEIQARQPDLALAWRMATREIFEAYFARGYRTVDFFLGRGDRCGKYLLAPRTAEP